jgi:hypothetical protein
MNIRCSSRSALILVLATWVATPALAQGMMSQTPMETEVASALDRPARLELEARPLRDALTRLSETSGVAIAFSPSAVHQVTSLVDCNCTAITVSEALERLLLGTSFEYSEFNSPSSFPRDRRAATDNPQEGWCASGVYRDCVIRDILPRVAPAYRQPGGQDRHARTTREPIPSVQVFIEGRASTLTDRDGVPLSNMPPGARSYRTSAGTTVGHAVDGQTAPSTS